MLSTSLLQSWSLNRDKNSLRLDFKRPQSKCAAQAQPVPPPEPPQRLCGKEYFQLRILGLQAPSFGLGHGRKCEICPTLTLSFLTRPRAAHEAKPRLWERDPGGIKGGAAGLPPGHGQTSFPWCPVGDTEGLSCLSSCQLFWGFFCCF